jgi:dTDP-4-amino-4,6-dideoxygalactose transaminase
MEGIQGLVLGQKLRHLAVWTGERKQIASRYLKELRELPLRLLEIVHNDHVSHFCS